MRSTSRYSLALALFLASVLIWAGPAQTAPKSETDDQVCDPLADYFLGMENYPEAIRRHLEVIRHHPGNSLAHYHLGFAYGLTGRHDKELREYRRAVDLGLSDWELFLNLGLLYLEGRHLSDATQVLRLATLLAPAQPETHFNLGIVYEQRGMLPQAEQEMLVAVKLDPRQADAHNSLGVIYAERGDYDRARAVWTELADEVPDYGPARDNLAILRRMENSQFKDTERASEFTHAQ